MFMVGVSLPYSIASRRAKGQTFGRMLAHSVLRALMLIALGIFLRSQARPQTYFTFEDVLTQIGLGYVFLFLLAWTRPRMQLAAAASSSSATGRRSRSILFPLAGFDTTTVGVRADWPHHVTGFAAHWDKNTNLAARVDQWFLNLFPRERPFVYNGGGYLTLNFVPSLATMIFGLLAARRAAKRPRRRRRRSGCSSSGAPPGSPLGLVVHLLGLCPIVKRIWTPSWTLFSGGWVVLFLAGYYYVIDRQGLCGSWTYPFLVVGANSIAMYVLVHVATDYLTRSWLIHFGAGSVRRFRSGVRSGPARRLHARALLGDAGLDVSPPRLRPHLTSAGLLTLPGWPLPRDARLARRQSSQDFKDVVAVDGIDLDVRAGECFGLLGPNGAGKTTTIEICEGLTEPDSGDVEVLGLRWASDAQALRQRLGIQLQETQLSDKLTVVETLRCSAASSIAVRRPTTSSRWCSWRRSATRGSARSRAARSSGWRSPARSSAIPTSCSSTSRPPGSIRRRGGSCGT